ncbi:MAG: SidA/IucD/PvdA family monooxygenase [Rhodobacteraceae bacterium]|nr:SidA/IucD/PvdA family monooxygenase [Paracoccaceae bacterium]
MKNSSPSTEIYDIVGIGFGPANIALAIALEELHPDKSFRFVDSQKQIVWQNEMLFENALDVYSNIQNSPHRDLATPRNPRSRYSFLNYLHENGLFWTQLNLNMSMPLRPDFANYIAWVAENFRDHFIGGTWVTGIEPRGDHYAIKCDKGPEILARHVVLGTGRPPQIPEQFQGIKNPNCIHFTKYNSSIEAMVAGNDKRIAIVGSSQTAAEIVLHLTKMHPQIEVDVIMRRFGFPLKDTTPFVSEIYFPEFTDLYFNSSEAMKRRIDRDVYGTNYGTADEDVIQEIYQQIYYDKLAGRNKLELHRLSEIKNVRDKGGKIEITINDRMHTRTFDKAYDGVILATGFVNYGPHPHNQKIPNLLQPLQHLLQLERGAVSVGRKYDLALTPEAPGKILMNGLCEVTHGMGDAGSISLMSLRAAEIASKAFEPGDSAGPKTASGDADTELHPVNA